MVRKFSLYGFMQKPQFAFISDHSSRTNLIKRGLIPINAVPNSEEDENNSLDTKVEETNDMESTTLADNSESAEDSTGNSMYIHSR